MTSEQEIRQFIETVKKDPAPLISVIIAVVILVAGFFQLFVVQSYTSQLNSKDAQILLCNAQTQTKDSESSLWKANYELCKQNIPVVIQTSSPSPTLTPTLQPTVSIIPTSTPTIAPTATATPAPYPPFLDKTIRLAKGQVDTEDNGNFVLSFATFNLGKVEFRLTIHGVEQGYYYDYPGQSETFPYIDGKNYKIIVSSGDVDSASFNVFPN